MGEKNCIGIMHDVCMKKFQQNDSIMNFLIQTGSNELVEASKNDKFWGCGIALSNKIVFNRDKWDGRNNLGRILMKVREHLT